MSVSLILGIFSFLGPFVPYALKFLDDQYKNGKLSEAQALKFIQLAEEHAKKGFELPSQLRESSLSQKERLAQYMAKRKELEKEKLKNENV